MIRLAAYALALFAASAAAIEPGAPLWRELGAGFGRQRADLVLPGQSLERQFRELLSGPPEAPVQLPGGLVLEAGCRLHSCDEKAAVISEAAGGRVLGIAARHFHCHAGSRGQTQCDRHPTLSIWILRHGRAAGREPEVTEALRAWGRAAGYANEETRFVRGGL